MALPREGAREIFLQFYEYGEQKSVPFLIKKFQESCIVWVQGVLLLQQIVFFLLTKGQNG